MKAETVVIWILAIILIMMGLNNSTTSKPSPLKDPAEKDCFSFYYDKYNCDSHNPFFF